MFAQRLQQPLQAGHQLPGCRSDIQPASAEFPKVYEGDLMADDAPKTMNPTALPVADAAELLTKIGGRQVTEATLQADIDGGAPTNADGTINLVNFAAWLVKELGRGD